MISTRIALHLLLASVVVGLGYAQQSRGSDSTASASSSSAPTEKASVAAEHVILKVGGVQITQAEFEASIGDIEPQGDPDKAGETEKDRRRLGDDYASVLMLSQQAIANHLESSPEVSRQLAVGRLQILSDAQFASLLRQSTPSHEEVSQYYSAHLPDYDRVQVHRLFIWKSGAGSTNAKGLAPEAARARADAILQASASGRDPKNLLEKFQGSDDGMLDAAPLTFSRGQMPPKMEKAAFALKEGGWTEADDTPDSIILLHLVKRDRRPLEELSSVIEQQLQGRKMQAKLDDLKKNAGIWMDEEYFGTAVATVPGEQRPNSSPPSKLPKSAEKTGDKQ